MVRILFGGPQEKERNGAGTVHNELVARLQSEGHEVRYYTQGKDMLVELVSGKIKKALPEAKMNPGTYSLVIYDTGLFYGQAEPYKKAEIFRETIIGYLKHAQVPVIVLAEPEVAELIRNISNQAGFREINQPYDIEAVVNEVNSSL